MKQSCKPSLSLIAAGLILGLAGASLPIQAQTLKKPALDALIASSAPTPPESFKAFAQQAARAEPGVAAAVQRYTRGQTLSDGELADIARLLGVYNRLTQETAVLESLQRMVALPTVRDPKVPAHESPAILDFGKLVASMATEFGLRFRNVDNRIFEVTLPANAASRASEATEFGILTHADVVPVVAAEWVLDGKQINPFQVTRVGDRLYGRGTIDDKGSIATVLYAMKAVKDSGLPLSRSIRLMIETTEETGGDAMKYYQSKTALPQYNIVLDSKYPAVVAEKGTGALKALFADVAVDAARPAITAMAAPPRPTPLRRRPPPPSPPPMRLRWIRSRSGCPRTRTTLCAGMRRRGSSPSMCSAPRAGHGQGQRRFRSRLAP
jgi:hypothetical protein